MAYLYAHIRLDTNEIFYIGIGSDAKYVRSKTNSSRNSDWHRIVDKYGFKPVVLIDGVSKEVACDLEREFISYYGRLDLGNGSLVNLTNGGNGICGIKRSDETRIKISNSHKGKRATEEVRKKMSASHKGKKISDEHRAKISLSQSKRVIDTSTGIIYNSTREVSCKFGINKSTLKNMLCGSSRNSTTFEYYN